MKNVLVIGSTGQIGSELTMKLRNMIPDGNIVAGYIPGAEPKGILLESGPAAEANVKNAQQLADIVEKYKIDTIYNLAALLSAVIFGLVHGTLLHLFYTIPMGLLLCLFYEKYRSLWAPILLHMSLLKSKHLKH